MRARAIAVAVVFALASLAHGSPRILSYQGSLLEPGGEPVVDSTYDMRFSIYDVALGGTALWTETDAAVEVTDGLFSTILGDGTAFWSTFFPWHYDLWLEVAIDVDRNATFDADEVYSPRQRLTAAPWAMDSDRLNGRDASAFAEAAHTHAGMGDITAVMAGAGLTGGGLSGDVTLGLDTAFTNGLYWSLGGNSGTSPGADFLGTSDDQPLELHVNNVRALRLEPTGETPNLIGGYSTNSVTANVYGATISGGGSHDQLMGASLPNRVTDDYGAVGGGAGNQAGDNAGDTHNAVCATVAGGRQNIAKYQYATVGGGYQNTAETYATIGGGYTNTASGAFAAVAGGNENTASVYAATVAGGRSNNSAASYATVAGGGYNVANGGYAAVGGGERNKASGLHASVSGGASNTASGRQATIGGGQDNESTATYATVAGGYLNRATSESATIGGGQGNEAVGQFATIGGGKDNQSTASYATVGGGAANVASGWYATVGGGNDNIADYFYATVGGGYNNRATTGNCATVAGGSGNTASGYYASVGGGINNKAFDNFATIGGGASNRAGDDALPPETAQYATVGGGGGNIADGRYATIPGGTDNVASGDHSFAAGRQAKANHDGVFVWADSNTFDFPSTTTNQFNVRATGGARFVSAIDGAGTPTAGVILDSGAGSWSTLSDRSLKENFAPVDGREVLARLADVPISTWNYRAQDEKIRHMGPMAQDLYAAFGLGDSDKTIPTIDADGVALAAIQGLHQIVLERDAEIADLKARLAALEATVAAAADQRRSERD